MIAARTVSAQTSPSLEDGSGGMRSGRITPRYAAGTADTVYQNFDGTHFIPATSTNPHTYVVGGGIYGSNEFRALLDLPQGATVTEITFSLLHNVVTSTTLGLFTYDANSNYDSSRVNFYTTQSASIVNVAVPLGTPLVIDNSLSTYVLRWASSTNAGTDVLFGARVGYTLPSRAQVYGAAQAGTGIYGTTATSPYAVAGHAYQNVGVYGLSGGGPYPYGVLGQNNAPGGFSLFGNASADGSVAFGGTAYGNALAGQFIGPVRVYGQIILQQQVTSATAVNAFIVGPGVTKNAAVEMPDGTHALMHCVESPEPWFEDFGEGTITGGKAEVKLDEKFLHTVDTRTMHVFPMSHDAHHALHVAAKSATGFTVGVAPSEVGLAAGKKATDLSGTFTYRVVAKRKDVSGERLAKIVLPKPIEAKLPSMPKK